MTLQPGYRLAVAPSFHLPVDWIQRVHLGAGIDRTSAGFSPRPPWRSADPAEQALLFPAQDMPAGCVCLFVLPQHLRAAWRGFFERPLHAEEALFREEFDSLVVEVARFLDFKEMAVPAGAVFDLVLTDSGQRSSHWHGAASGLTFNLPGTTRLADDSGAGGLGLWGGINLGDEAASLVFVNLSPAELLAACPRFSPQAPPQETLAELAERLLTACPDYPPVRLNVEPGEGFRLPAGGILVDGCTLDRSEPDVLLLVRQR